MSVSIKYKGNTIASASTETTKTIKTAGKYCEADIIVENTPDSGADPVINPLSVTANGTYTAPSGVDGYSPVTVNVPQGITPTGNINITENGTYDVTEYAEAVVDVSGGTIENGLIFTELNANGEPLSADFYGEYIGAYMFGANVSTGYQYNLDTLRNLYAKNVKTVGADGLRQTKLEFVTISESCTAIGGSAFRGKADGADTTIKVLGNPTFENYVFYQCYKLKTCQLGSIGYPITAIPNNTFSGDTRVDLEITVYSTQAAYSTVLANIRNGATNATIIVKDSTTGEVIVTSTP